MSKHFILICILLLGFFLRLYKINLPLLEFYPSRQVQTADITRNFLRYDFNIIKPAVSYLGPGYIPFLVEFPGYNFVVAFVYKIAGNSNEVYGRLVSILGWTIAAIILYRIALILSSRTVALTALFFFTISPLSVLISRSFQPDQWALTMSLASILFFLISLRKKSGYLFYLSAFLCSIAVLVKPQVLVFTLLPIFVFSLVKKGRSLLENLYYLLISIIPAFGWYFYAAFFSKKMGLITTGNFSLNTWFGLEVFLNPKYYNNIFGFELNLVLLPIGILLVLFGLSIKLAKRQHFLYWWFAFAILYFLIFNKHNMTHEYYHLPFLPIAAIFIGIGTERVFKIFDNSLLPKELLILVFAILTFIIMLPPTLARAYRPIDRFSHVQETAIEVQKFTKPDDLIIGSMDAGPALVYYSDRHGWPFEINREETVSQFQFWGHDSVITGNNEVTNPISNLENLRGKGATIFASSYKKQFVDNGEFSNYMKSQYEILEESDNFIIFDIRSKKNVSEKQ